MAAPLEAVTLSLHTLYNPPLDIVQPDEKPGLIRDSSEFILAAIVPSPVSVGRQLRSKCWAGVPHACHTPR